MNTNDNSFQSLVKSIRALTLLVAFLLGVIVLLLWLLLVGPPDLFSATTNPTGKKKQVADIAKPPVDTFWHAPDTSKIPHNELGERIRYGRKLVANTAYYLGPEGVVAKITNGMNCQNCHLDAGTKPWGNNYVAVAATYPKFRARSGAMESITKRVNDCIERSLNGTKLDSLNREMLALVAYITWVGSEVPKGKSPAGSGIYVLKKMSRPADPQKGKIIYAAKCASCHGNNGEGKKADAATYQYPPLWGDHSYNIGAGLYRLSRFAGYVKANMPFGVNWDTPQLSDEACWDVAAFVNSQPHPNKDISADWPDISKKPSDHPFGPFSDSFPMLQHKYGPFGPIDKAHKK